MDPRLVGEALSLTEEAVRQVEVVHSLVEVVLKLGTRLISMLS